MAFCGTRQPCLTFFNYIPWFRVDAITYPRSEFSGCFVKPRKPKDTLWQATWRTRLITSGYARSRGFIAVSWWCHQMETFLALLAICAGNSPVSGEFHAQRPVTWSFGVFFDLRLNKGWVNNREAGDLRRYRAHYDVTVMLFTGDTGSLWIIAIDDVF